MDIQKHFELLLDKYNLKGLYYKFIFTSILASIIKESFYLFLLYSSSIVKDSPEYMKRYSIILIGLLFINIPMEKIHNDSKIELMKEIKLANSKYFNDRITKLSKDKLLNFDLVEYYNILETFNENIELYIMNIKNMYNIPIRGITLIAIAINMKFNLLIILFIILYFIIKILNDNKLLKEIDITKKYFVYKNMIRNYFINSKHTLINNDFNDEYITNKINNVETITQKISDLTNVLDMKINVIMFIFIIIVILCRIDKLNKYDFFYYFLVVYDIEHIADKYTEYYKNKVIYTKMQERLNYLNSFIPEYKNFKNKRNIENIIIKNIKNEKPKLICNNELIINKNDHILINGESGSGKTTLLYILKGIIKCDNLNITPNIELINSQTFITLPNHKNLFNGKLYNIITNYSSNPNIELIEYCLKEAKIYHKLNKNIFINIEKLSSGERVRLLIARIIYTVKNKNYNILLFDEIDDNLNDELVLEIYNNLKNVFHDKIVFYVTHNENLKKLFNKIIYVKNGEISI